jgi:hypothetical protein
MNCSSNIQQKFTEQLLYGRLYGKYFINIIFNLHDKFNINVISILQTDKLMFREVK